MDLAKCVYVLTKSLPSDERFGLVTQMRRAAFSVPMNIAEGYGRPTTAQFMQFLGVAEGSLLEVQTALKLCDELNISSSTESAWNLTYECTRLFAATNATLRRKQNQK